MPFTFDYGVPKFQAGQNPWKSFDEILYRKRSPFRCHNIEKRHPHPSGFPFALAYGKAKFLGNFYLKGCGFNKKTYDKQQLLKKGKIIMTENQIFAKILLYHTLVVFHSLWRMGKQKFLGIFT
jgi:hypothetical protein